MQSHLSLDTLVVRLACLPPELEWLPLYIHNLMYSVPGMGKLTAYLFNRALLTLKHGFCSPTTLYQGALVSMYSDDAEKAFTRTSKGTFPFNSSFSASVVDSGNPELDLFGEPRYEAAIDRLQAYTWGDQGVPLEEQRQRQQRAPVSNMPNAMKGEAHS